MREPVIPPEDQDAIEAFVIEALEVINAGHPTGCPWLRNAAAPCTCGLLHLGCRVEVAIRTAYEKP